jgi:hypothetical protein
MYLYNWRLFSWYTIASRLVYDIESNTWRTQNNKSRARLGVATGKPGGLSAAQRVADVTESRWHGVRAGQSAVARGKGVGSTTALVAGEVAWAGVHNEVAWAGGTKRPWSGASAVWGRRRYGRGQKRGAVWGQGKDADFAVTILEGSWQLASWTSVVWKRRLGWNGTLERRRDRGEWKPLIDDRATWRN